MDHTSLILGRKFGDVGGLSCASFNRLVFMEHGNSSDSGVGRVTFGQNDAEQRYLAWRAAVAMERIASSLETIVFAFLFAYVIYVLAEVAARFLTKDSQS